MTEKEPHLLGSAVLCRLKRLFNNVGFGRVTSDTLERENGKKTEETNHILLESTK